MWFAVSALSLLAFGIYEICLKPKVSTSTAGVPSSGVKIGDVVSVSVNSANADIGFPAIIGSPTVQETAILAQLKAMASLTPEPLLRIKVDTLSPVGAPIATASGTLTDFPAGRAISAQSAIVKTERNGITV